MFEDFHHSNVITLVELLNLLKFWFSVLGLIIDNILNILLVTELE